MFCFIVGVLVNLIIYAGLSADREDRTRSIEETRFRYPDGRLKGLTTFGELNGDQLNPLPATVAFRRHNLAPWHLSWQWHVENVTIPPPGTPSIYLLANFIITVRSYKCRKHTFWGGVTARGPGFWRRRFPIICLGFAVLFFFRSTSKMFFWLADFHNDQFQISIFPKRVSFTPQVPDKIRT
jgi:hypothetical protein